MITNVTTFDLEEMLGELEEICDEVDIRTSWFDFDDYYDEGHDLYD